MSKLFVFVLVFMAAPVMSFLSSRRVDSFTTRELSPRALVLRAKSSEGWDGENEEELSDEMELQKRKGRGWKAPKKAKDRRDHLPFDVLDMTPPTKLLGSFRLHPHTNCGDLLTYNDDSFLVRRVACNYKYSGGALRMFKKTAHVVELNRAFQERSLERLAGLEPGEAASG